MSSLKEAVSISEMPDSSLWVIWGRSASGKTNLLASFPKPLLYLQMGDDGTNSIKDIEGIDVIKVKSISHLKTLLQDARMDKKYETVAADTFGMFVNLWIDENAISKKKKMTQQMWGDLQVDMNECIKSSHILAQIKNVVLTFHEISDSYEGMEDEIAPDIRPNLNKASRSFLEGMANYGIHTTILSKTKMINDVEEVVQVYACHLGGNPYYWVKTQKPASVKLPKVMLNPTYTKITNKLKGV